MKNLIAIVRLEALRKNLEQIKNFSDSVKSRRRHVESLDKLLEQADLLSYNLESDTKNLPRLADPTYLTRYPDRIIPELREKLVKAAEDTSALAQLVSNALDIVKSMRERMTPLTTRLDDGVKGDIGKRTEAWDRALTSAENVLQGGAKMDEAWRDSIGEAYKQSQALSSEYVNLIGGLALRDTGFDEDMCRIADELIRSCGKLRYMAWESLTIPSRRGALTLARIIRMGFPEWSIWALPLTAHELGQVIATEDKGIDEFIEGEAEKLAAAAKAEQCSLIAADEEALKECVRVCVSDALAACAMGPAYACALLLLHLNPLSAFKGDGTQPPHAWRAHITLHMLQLMSGEGVGQKVYQNIIDILKKEWNCVLEQTNGQGAALDAAAAARLEGWVAFIWKDLEKDPVIYKGEHWTHMKEAVANLVTKTGMKWYVTEAGRRELESDPDNRGEIGELQVDGAEQWRDILNAVWAFRVEQLFAGQRVSSEAIAEKVSGLWRLISLKQQERSQSSSSALSSGRGATVHNVYIGGKFS